MTYTALFCTSIMVIVAIYDAIAVSFGGVDVSVSRWVQNTAFASPPFVLAVGFLLGHFFGYMRPIQKRDS